MTKCLIKEDGGASTGTSGFITPCSRHEGPVMHRNHKYVRSVRVHVDINQPHRTEYFRSRQSLSYLIAQYFMESEG
jgi:hypothetical protein